MILIGKRTWWLPAWLDRALPRLNVEGSAARGAGQRSDDDERGDDPRGDDQRAGDEPVQIDQALPEPARS
jgi:RND superfamily putative drug exporter